MRVVGEISIQRVEAVSNFPVIRHAGGISHPDAFAFDDAERVCGGGIVDESAVVLDHVGPTERSVGKEDI